MIRQNLRRWNLDEDGPFSEDAGYSKMRKLGHDLFSEVFRVSLKGSLGAKFPFHAHGDASLEMQMIGSSRYFFPNQDPVSLYAFKPVFRPHTSVYSTFQHSPKCMHKKQSTMVMCS